jgi:hypothetical protein
MDNKTIIESATKIGELQTRTYLPLFLYQASEKNTRLIAEKNLEQFTPYGSMNIAKQSLVSNNSTKSSSITRPHRERDLSHMVSST